jgi:hypothetical protein
MSRAPEIMKIGELEITLRPDRLLSTVNAILYESPITDKEIRKALGPDASPSAWANRYLLAARVQIEWYTRFDSKTPQAVLNTLAKCEAAVAEAKRRGIEEAEAKKELPTALKEHQFTARVDGPTALAKQMIADNKSDAQILAMTLTRYPDKKFVKGDLNRLRKRMA